ncbi:MAG: NAD(+)/NADH kinase [Coriobacteriia bacterium]|nr:NAD(+)/NADH kinase [Coriobacteriia bacterium]
MRVLLVPDITNESALRGTGEIAAWCGANGIEPALVAADAEACGLEGFGIASRDIGEPVLVVALGGDGTILKAVHLVGDVAVPILGVKFGRLGFLSGATPERMREAILSTLAGDVLIERRTTLKAEVIMDGRNAGTYRALNEVVVSRGTSRRVIAFDIHVGGHEVARLSGDGVIVATATGSTAYALSAGGPVVAPGFGGMVIVPVAAHTLRSRALVTEAAETVEIVLSDPQRSDACITVDGAPMPCRRAVERLVVSRAEHDVLLAKLDGRDFYETVAEEFFGGR